MRVCKAWDGWRLGLLRLKSPALLHDNAVGAIDVSNIIVVVFALKHSRQRHFSTFSKPDSDFISKLLAPFFLLFVICCRPCWRG